ncbi:MULTISPECIES: DUF805 domain-containing protein [unclassified Mannheimia]|uniref:DUF805 domain-containing protein n=1 Tax=unclassified Mannheimia TaxID=2645054 RepID=UPI00359DE8AB
MRRSRLNYIFWSIVNWVFFFIVTTILFNKVSYYDFSSRLEYEGTIWTYTIIMLIMLVAQSIMMISLSRDRLKDMGKDPIWSWAVILPFVWLYFAFAKGTDGDNQYGKSPKDLRAEKKVQEAEQQALTNPTDIDLVLQNMGQFCSPPIGRIESINFRISEENERYFYAIPPESVKKLRQRLEILAKRLQDDEDSYGYLYAERRFYIGDKLMFSWSNEVKI